MDEDWTAPASRLQSKQQQITVGEDLSPFSQEDLSARIKELEKEITRVKAEIEARDKQASLAQNLFKSGT